MLALIILTPHQVNQIFQIFFVWASTEINHEKFLYLTGSQIFVNFVEVQKLQEV